MYIHQHGMQIHQAWSIPSADTRYYRNRFKEIQQHNSKYLNGLGRFPCAELFIDRRDYGQDILQVPAHLQHFFGLQFPCRLGEVVKLLQSLD